MAEAQRTALCSIPNKNASTVQKKVGMQKVKNDDRRIQRTRTSLTQALLSLLPERGWDELTVQDLCDRANIGRSTFYAHFQNKEELLASGLNDLRAFLSERQSPPANEHTTNELAFVRGLIEHINENKILCRAIFGRRSGHVVQMRFREMVEHLVREHLAHAPPEWRRDAAVHFISGALVEMLAWFVDSGSGVSVEEVERHFRNLAYPAVRELLAPNVSK